MRLIAAQRLAVFTLLCVLAALPAPAADPAAGPQPPADGDVCPVCGMRVAPHGDWIAQVIFADGSAAFFDGAKDLFKYLLGRDRYLPEKRGVEIAATFVTGYYALAAVPAAEALYVIGSDVHGPMGPELVPHPDRAEAEEFLRDHRGERIVRFDEVTAELLHTLDGHGRKPHHGGR